MMRLLSPGWYVVGLAVLRLASCASADAAERTVRYGFTVENTTDRMVHEGHLWTYAPIEQTAYQTCAALDASHPYVLETDAWGNRVLHFTFKDLPPYRQVLVRVEARLDMRQEPDQAAVEPARVEGPLYDLADEDFSRLVPAFELEDPAALTRKVYRWTASYLRYDGYDRVDRGAAHALRTRAGDCTEYMALMAAVCRRYDVPVRGMAGYVYERSAVVRPNDLHNWTEVLIDGRWWVADPLMKVFREGGDRYVSMYTVGNVTNAMNGFARFRFEGDGLKVTMANR